MGATKQKDYWAHTMGAIKKDGFTIVELLIVIVVIAILAAITIVSFNGIQARAKNTSQTSTAAQYIKLFRLYKIQNGAWPTQTGCLGENNLDTNANGIADCGDNGTVQVNAALNTQLRTVGSLPSVITDQIQGTTATKSAGIYFNGVTGDGRAMLVWFVRGTAADCKPPSTNPADFIPGNDGQRVWCQYWISE